MAASFAFAEFLGGINTTAPAALDEERNEPRFNSMTEGEAAKNVVVNEVIGAGIALGITRTVGRFAKYLNKTDDVARVVPTEAPVARLGDESPTTPLSVGNEGGASHDKLRKILESMGEPEPSLTPIAGGSTSAGPWTKLNERKVGDEVAQLGDETCGHACVEYMAGVPQKQLIQELGSHSQQAHEMSRHLGPNWIGGAVPNTSVEANLLAAPKDWMAMLKSPMAKAGTPGHYVVVKGSEPSDAGMLTLKDPHGEGTTYEMTVPEFLTNWTRQFLFKKD
jgi:hypothetical protein